MPRIIPEELSRTTVSVLRVWALPSLQVVFPTFPLALSLHAPFAVIAISVGMDDVYYTTPCHPIPILLRRAFAATHK
jgi:hypothetical protein